jgi:diadenosine tetraphosphate (Ap4A) HIT family hydrolase
LKNARFRCELCGVSAEERALEVDHITPRNNGGGDELENLQALCFSCDAMKRDHDDTDFRAVRASYQDRRGDCPFCEMSARRVLRQNSLAAAIADEHPVTLGHALIFPFRHVSDYFDLGAPELRACQVLVSETRAVLLRDDSSISGFNVGVNSGSVAGQTVMHCHIHLIPRREGDAPNPRGGVRAVIPGKADY